MPRRFLRRLAGATCLMLLTASSLAFVPTAETGDAAPKGGTTAEGEYKAPVRPASDEAARALGGFRVPPGMTAKLLAAEPLVANPVAFSIDNAGTYWVCETFRQGNAVVDNRDYGKWLLADLAAQTVEDRLAFYTKYLTPEQLAAFTREHDRVRKLTDRDGDGVLDTATVFADGFNSPVEGTGAGVLALGNDVYYTNIPNLWKLEDTNNDGVADDLNQLATGFGVRVAFRGHDMHGTRAGTGRAYLFQHRRPWF